MTVPSVQRRLDTRGTLGLVFDRVVSPRVAALTPGSPAAAAGLPAVAAPPPRISPSREVRR